MWTRRFFLAAAGLSMSSCARSINAYMTTEEDTSAYFDKWEDLLRQLNVEPEQTSDPDSMRLRHTLRVMILASVISDLQERHVRDAKILKRIDELGSQVGVSLNALTNEIEPVSSTDLHVLQNQIAQDPSMQKSTLSFVEKSLRQSGMMSPHRRHILNNLKKALNKIAKGSECGLLGRYVKSLRPLSRRWTRADLKAQANSERFVQNQIWAQRDTILESVAKAPEEPMESDCRQFDGPRAAWVHALEDHYAGNERSIIKDMVGRKSVDLLVPDPAANQVQPFLDALRILLNKRDVILEVHPKGATAEAGWYVLNPVPDQDGVILEFEVRRVSVRSPDLTSNLSLLDANICTANATVLLRARAESLHLRIMAEKTDTPVDNSHYDVQAPSVLSTPDWEWDAEVPVSGDSPETLLLLPLMLFLIGFVFAGILLTQTALERRRGNPYSSRMGFFAAIARITHPAQQALCW